METFSGFAKFFKRYAGAWPVILACLIGPVTKYLQLVPVYQDHQNVLAGVTTLYGLLLAAALFFYRRIFFRRKRSSTWARAALRAVPGILILVSVGAFFRYLAVVEGSVRARRGAIQSLVDPEQLQTRQILFRTDFTNIPDGPSLLGWYLFTFLTAETSFVVFALAEYVGDGEIPKARVRKNRSSQSKG